VEGDCGGQRRSKYIGSARKTQNDEELAALRETVGGDHFGSGNRPNWPIDYE